MSKLHFKHRFIENGPVVVCITNFWFTDAASKRKIGGQVRAKARVNEAEGDVYNVQTGRDLSRAKAISKAYAKVIKTETRRIKWFETITKTLTDQKNSLAEAAEIADKDLATLKESL